VSIIVRLLLLAVLSPFVLLGALGCSAKKPPVSLHAFLNPSFGFEITYDPQKLRVGANDVLRANDGPILLAGSGWVPGDEESVSFVPLRPHSQGGKVATAVDVIAVRTLHVVQSPSVVSFRHESYYRRLVSAGVVTGAVRRTTLGGNAAFAFDTDLKGVRGRDYRVYSGRFVYDVGVHAPANEWREAAPLLLATARTFRVVSQN